MPNQFQHADALREYLTGAASDGGSQGSPSASLGHFRSSAEAVSLGISIANAISGVTVLFASGGNAVGQGTLTAVDSTHLKWQPYGDPLAGVTEVWAGTQTKIVEALNNPSAYLRITAIAPFTAGASQITLSTLYNNAFGFDNVVASDATAGLSQYRATIVRNESGNTVSGFKRWIAQLGTVQVSNGGGLGASGSGTITTTGTFADWPASGWCQVRSSGGTLKEVVYYTSRTTTALTVPNAGRALLGTTATAGSNTDSVYAVPGVAIALEPGGTQAFGSSIQTTASQTTAPTGVTWNLGLDATTGLSIGNMNANTQIGIWIWRQIPAGAVATPSELIEFADTFAAF